VTVTQLDVTLGQVPGDREAFEISFISDDGVEHRTGLAEAWAAPFEAGLPVRRFLNRPGVSGDFDPWDWEGWSHVQQQVREVPAGAQRAGGAHGRGDPRRA
jgi:hypothetical protein